MRHYTIIGFCLKIPHYLEIQDSLRKLQGPCTVGRVEVSRMPRRGGMGTSPRYYFERIIQENKG
jgi:hypothetical protein